MFELGNRMPRITWARFPDRLVGWPLGNGAPGQEQEREHNAQDSHLHLLVGLS